MTSRTIRCAALVALLLALAVPAASAASLASGTVDVTGATAPAWRGLAWTPTASGATRISLARRGTGSLRLDLRLATDNA